MAAGEDEVAYQRAASQPVKKFEEVHEALHGPPGLVEGTVTLADFEKSIMRLLRLADFLKQKTPRLHFLLFFMPSLKSLS